MNSGEDVLFKYVKGKNGQKLGIILSTVIDNDIVIGFSLCNKNLDIFDRNIGYNIAHGRALTYSKCSIFDMDDLIPKKLREEIYYFILRSKRYYKQYDLVLWAKDFIVDFEENDLG